ncbi:hypothetical protein DPEC_G00305420 [Dallia pectoralis]|uniref:Uncharacterized protein n=1 Tax=Dallia pectoralis TaxID=75939 RepID=A0ACC2FDZ6_DALPE|nr:hypothetical protein DPEC_G00305420 [Dallia pectoralis]
MDYVLIKQHPSSSSPSSHHIYLPRARLGSALPSSLSTPHIAYIIYPDLPLSSIPGEIKHSMNKRRKPGKMLHSLESA